MRQIVYRVFCNQVWFKRRSNKWSANLRFQSTKMSSAVNQENEKLYQSRFWSARPKDQLFPQHYAHCKTEGEKAISTTPVERDIVYGLGEKQKLDIFGAESVPSDAPIFVYIHGGYWQRGSRPDYWFVAPPLVKAGALVVNVGYDLAPTVTVAEIVNEVRAATSHVMQLAKKRGSRGIYIGGHSVGGHLTAMMIATDWTRLHKEDSKLIKGAVMISGVFDVRPLVHTTINEPLHLTEESAWELSPINYLTTIQNQASHATVLLRVGEHESPAFHEQSQNFAKALQEIGIQANYSIIPDRDHFDLVEQLAYPENKLTKEIVHLMGL